MDSAFKLNDARSYNHVASAFDRLSEVYSAPFADDLLDLAALQSGALVLDLAAGTGLVSRRVVARGGRCVAADLSAGMLRVARNSSSSLSCVQMDGERAALHKDSVDAVVCLFGMLHFPDPGAALRECERHLTPGGILAVAFGTPAPWPRVARELPRIALDRLRRQRGQLLKAPMALAERLEKEYPGIGDGAETNSAAHPTRVRASFVELAKEAGFREIRTGWMRKRFQIESPEAFWDLQTVFSSRVRKSLTRLSPGEMQRLERSFLSNARAVQDRGGELIYDVGASWIRGIRPALLRG